MIGTEQLFKYAKEKGADEIYLVAGDAPRMKINGKIITISYPDISSDDMQKFLLSVFDTEHMEKYKKDKNCETVEYNYFGTFCINIFQCNGNPHCVIKCCYEDSEDSEDNNEESKKGLSLEEKELMNRFVQDGSLIIVAGINETLRRKKVEKMIKFIGDEYDLCITTLENPIERRIKISRGIINQKEYRKDFNDYMDELAALSGQSSDMIYYSGIDDQISAKSAVLAAMMGYKVIAGVKACDIKKADAVIKVFLYNNNIINEEFIKIKKEYIILK